MVMYRPFLHYVSSGSQARGVDRRSYACAAACVSVSRNIVHITTGMHKKGLLNGSFWFTMYTTYFAILSLLFFVLENPDSPTAKDGVLKDAMEGKNTLAGLAKKSLAADRCSQSLNSLFKNLPEMLKNRQSSKTQVNLKRPAPSNQPAPDVGPPQRASTFPNQLLTRPSKPDVSQTPKSLDDNQPPRSPARKPRANRRSWAQPTEHPASVATTPSETTPPSASTPSMIPQTLPIRDTTTGQFNQQFPNNAAAFPDLMNIMFPSDDPFAYPTQPMSTLEDGHFRMDGTGTTAPFSSAMSTMIDQNIGAPNVSRGLDPLGGLPLFQGGQPQSSMGAALSGRLSNSRMQSPVSHGSTTGEAVNSPDLVSIPNQNFIWQGYGSGIDQQQNFVPDATMQQMPTGNEQGFGMGTDDNAFNVGIDLPLDDIFGNPDIKNGFPSDDWTQWMNIG